MLPVRRTTQFKKDVKRAKRRRKDFTDQREVLRITVHSGELSIDFEADAEEVRSLLSRHSDELIDSIVR